MLVISLGCSIRQTAKIARWVSSAVIRLPCWISSSRGKCSKFAYPLPTRGEILVEPHEFRRGRDCLFFARQFENRVAADDLFGLYKWAVDNSQFAVCYANLRPGGEGCQAAHIEQAPGSDFSISELVHRLQEFRRRRSMVSGFDYEHKAHLMTPYRASRGAIAEQSRY
jgi:hypothetical protein